MSLSLDQLLPSLQSLGVWTYWILALFAMFEAIVVTGFIAPGALAVIGGGILVQRGAIDFFDLAWFVLAGTVLGSEVSYRLGRLAARGLAGRGAGNSAHAARAKTLLERYGGFAMVLGRFLGPLSAFVPFSAALSGMSRRRFNAWNLGSALPYALLLPALGYFFGSAVGRVGSAAPRVALFVVAALGALGLLWLVFARLRRAAPLVAAQFSALRRAMGTHPRAQAFARRHPRLTAFTVHRFDTDRFSGLAATMLGLLFLYLLGAYVDSVFDFLGDQATGQLDARVANLFYAFRDERLLRVFSWITAFGYAQVLAPILLGVSAALWAVRRWGLLTGLWVAVIGNQLSVTLLKIFFGRPRPVMSYFVESSNSFPSGHAAASVAVWGMVFYILWRLRLLPALIAGFAAISVAFLIGLSRLYLDVHFLSDVVNGWLVGGLWLVIGIAISEWRRSLHPPRTQRARGMALGLVLAGMTGALAVMVLNTPRSKADFSTTPQVIADLATLTTGQELPPGSETLTGQPLRPLALLAVAADGAALEAAMATAGWRPADTLSAGLLVRGVWADWRGTPPPAGLILPAFWSSRPNDLGFERAGPQGRRLVARFWETRWRTAAGSRIFAATVGPQEAEGERQGSGFGPLSAAERQARDKLLADLGTSLRALGPTNAGGGTGPGGPATALPPVYVIGKGASIR